MVILKCILLNVDDYLSFFQMEKAVDKSSPLQNKSSHKHVESNTAESITLQECHQKTESNEHHHVNILEHCIHKKHCLNIWSTTSNM